MSATVAHNQDGDRCLLAYSYIHCSPKKTRTDAQSHQLTPYDSECPPKRLPTGLEAQPAGQSQRKTLQRQIATRDDTPTTENDGKRLKTTENDRERQRTTLQRRFRTTENDRKRLKTTGRDSEPHPDRLAHDTASQRWPRRGPTAQIQHSPDVTAPQHAFSFL